MDTFVFIRTSLTTLTFVDSHRTDISVPVFTMPVIQPFELPSVCTYIFVRFRIILHVLPPADILSIFPGLRDLIILRLQIGFLTILFQENISFFAFISGVSNDLLVLERKMIIHVF